MSTDTNTTPDPSTDSERRDHIIKLGEQYSRYVSTADVARACREGMTVDKFLGLIVDKQTSRHTDTRERVFTDMRQQEGREYSLMNVIRAQLDPNQFGRHAGFETEMAQELRRSGQSVGDGITVPGSYFYPAMHQRDVLQIGTAGLGGDWLPTVMRPDLFADALRAWLYSGRLGARILTGLTSNVDIPTKSAVTTVGWLGEIGTASATNPTAAKITLSPKRISAYVDVSKQAILQSGVPMEPMIRDDLVRSGADLIDKACLYGAGTASQPTGIVPTTGIGTVTGGTNGAAWSWTIATEFERVVAEANGVTNPSLAGYLVNPRSRSFLKRTQKGTSLAHVWPDIAMSPDGLETLNGYRAAVSSIVRSNLTKGTSTTVCSEAVFSGDWSELVLGYFGAPDVTIDPYTLATQGQVRITLNQYVDVGVRVPGVFAYANDLLTT